MLAVKTAVGPTIQLQSGTYFDLLDPWNSEFTIEDIAHGLSLMCRFAGQCNRFYSVAEHSLYVSFAVAPEHAFVGLMHDAAESFIGDVTRPLKSLLPAYKTIEKDIEAAIGAKFGFDPVMPPQVKRADLALLATEQAQLMPGNHNWASLAGISPLGLTIACNDPIVAKTEFLNRFEELRQ